MGFRAGDDDTQRHMKIPKIIHQTWRTKDIPFDVYKKEWIDSWKRLHPDWEYRLWTDEENRDLIKKEYPWFLETYDGYPEGIYRADAARYFILYHCGGLYADLDFQALKNVEPLLEGHDIVLSYVGRNKRAVHALSNAIMASSRKASLWPMVFREMKKKKRKTSSVDIATGAMMFKGVVMRYLTLRRMPFLGRIFFDAKIKIYESSYLCPLDWSTWTLLGERVPQNLKSDPAHFLPDSYAVTYWKHNY